MTRSQAMTSKSEQRPALGRAVGDQGSPVRDLDDADGGHLQGEGERSPAFQNGRRLLTFISSISSRSLQPCRHRLHSASCNKRLGERLIFMNDDRKREIRLKALLLAALPALATAA